MKFKPGADINNPGKELLAPGAVPGDDMVSRINAAITNFKGVLELANELRNKEPNEGIQLGTNPKQGPGLSDYIQLINKAGLGDTPIGKIIEQISPHSINKIVELLKNARPEG